MKSWLMTIVGVGISFLLLGSNFTIEATEPTLMIDEFVVYPNSGEEEWIELLNPNQTSALDLSGYRLVVHQGPEDNYTYYYSQDLSGSVPRGGFLTFTVGNGTTMPDEGACVVIFRTDTDSVYAVMYGNGTCDAGAGEQDASGVAIEQGKSIYYNLTESSWNSAESPTRGWCNPGSGDCPTISTITDQLSNEGVVTNLGTQTDFSRISGLYFRKSQNGENIGQITFLGEMNFTDRDALTWMQGLDSKLDISQGIISLDADLIKNLTDTQASLTMYNISFNNPTIRVTNSDGSSGDSSIVSGLSYDRARGTLTFTAAHFTTFTVVENSSSGSSGGSVWGGPPACGDWTPLTKPDLFQIDTGLTSATLYFTPVTDYLTYYFIAYGYEEGDWRFGAKFDSDQKNGVVSYTVNELVPNTSYYFTVRGGNGCAPGEWSNYRMAKTKAIKRVVKETELRTEKERIEAAGGEVMGGYNQEEEKADKENKGGEDLEKNLIEKEEDSKFNELNQEPNQAPIKINSEKESISFWQKIVNFLKSLLGSRQKVKTG